MPNISAKSASKSSSKSTKTGNAVLPAETTILDTPTEEPRVKKRGRKPRGGKIIATEAAGLAVSVPEPNVILHLRCGKADLSTPSFFCTSIPEPALSGEFSGDVAGGDSLLYEILQSTSSEPPVKDNVEDCSRTLWGKLDELAVALHTNDISDKKSACFWDSCDFDSPPIHIPKFILGGTYNCYGCFCSPECATAYLFRETLDTATRFERYALLNHLYCKIYDYNKNVKPAPDPFHTLDKFYGNLSIQEYRQHLKSERILLVVDKPLTRTLPELHEDNDEFVLNTKAIPSSGQFKLRRSRHKPTKAEVLAENFNMK